MNFVTDIVYVAAILIVAFFVPAEPIKKNNFFIGDMYIAQYGPENVGPFDYERMMSEGVIQAIANDTFYDDKKNLDLSRYLPKLVQTGELEKLNEINNAVNNLFSYQSNEFNYWYSESPLVALMLRYGDCKAYAAYKYHLLKQLGYKNVKIITATIAVGDGTLGGHALVLVNDLWVLDINYPYFYPIERLRMVSGLGKAFDETGVKDLQ